MNQDIFEPVKRFFQQQKFLGTEHFMLEKKLSNKLEKLDQMWIDECKGCTKCRLSEGRTQVVFGAGDPEARLVIVGEAPGQEEDRQGVPFVGRSGKLLTKMLEDGMKIPRSKIYICNVVKCRPPENRTPLADEMAICEPYLKKQLQIIKPEVIIAMGNCAVKCLLRTTEGITKLRGKFSEYEGIPIMPTFHPAYLLRYPALKSEAWQDLQKVMRKLGLPIPTKDK